MPRLQKVFARQWKILKIHEQEASRNTSTKFSNWYFLNKLSKAVLVNVKYILTLKKEELPNFMDILVRMEDLNLQKVTNNFGMKLKFDVEEIGFSQINYEFYIFLNYKQGRKKIGTAVG